MKISGPKNKKWRRELRSCANCGRMVWVKRCRIKPKNYCSRTCASEGFKGHIPWNKGLAKVSTENELFRKSNKYKDWRKSVFERDDYVCQMCGQRGGKLQADHIKPFAIFKDKRLDINNGRTLCEDCHKKTDTYGYKSVKLKKQYEKTS